MATRVMTTYNPTGFPSVPVDAESQCFRVEFYAMYVWNLGYRHRAILKKSCINGQRVQSGVMR